MIDTLIRGGLIVDGTGRPAFSGDIAIADGKIGSVGATGDISARRVIDATGKVVTPGFIDIHRHADAAAFRPGFGSLELCQGLTTIVNGNCGLSVAPFGTENGAAIRAYLTPITGVLPEDMPTDTMAHYLSALHDLPIHCAMLAGAGVVRADVAGYGRAHMTDGDMQTVHRNLEKALRDGALGISLGLGYAPECFYTTEELIQALAPVAGTSIPVTVHMRQEGTGVVESVQEMLEVAKALRCPMHISHLKAMGRSNWGKKIPQALSLLERACRDGLNVSCDVYPYTAGSTQLLHILPPDFLRGGMEAAVGRLADRQVRNELAMRIESGEGFDNIAKLAGWDGIYLTSLQCPENRQYQGKNLVEIAEMTGQSPLDACCELLIKERGRITMIDFMAAEEDICAILRSPLSNVISDSTYPTEGKPHPRVYGTFTRMIEHFVVDKHVLSLEEAVHKMTMAPAEVLGMANKGRLQVNCDADLCIFAPEDLHEMATYEDSTQMSRGMAYVLVGGRIALENGKPTGICAGEVVRR